MRFVLTPHRSLPRRGFLVLMALVSGVSCIAGLAFFLMGAWPVSGILGLDALLVWLAFRLNYAAAEKAEEIEIGVAVVTLRRLAKGAVTETQRFDRAWLRIELEHDAERDLTGALRMVQGGRRQEVGGFLGPAEKQSLARALRHGLTQRRKLLDTRAMQTQAKTTTV